MPARKPPRIPFPKSWSKRVRSALLHVISLAPYVTVATRSLVARSASARVRLKSQYDRLRQEVVLLQEETHIKDARLLRIAPYERPHYHPSERMAIPQRRAARGWSQPQTTDAFHVTAATAASVDETRR